MNLYPRGNTNTARSVPMMIMLVTLLLSDGLGAVARPRDTIEPGTTWVTADAEIPPTQRENQARSSEDKSSSDDRYATPANRQGDNSPSDDRYATPTNRQGNTSPSDDRYATPTNRQGDGSSSYDRYATPTNRQGDGSSSYDRYATPTNRQGDNSSSYDRYATPVNKQGNNSSSYGANNQNGPNSGSTNPLDWLNQLGGVLAQPRATNSTTQADPNQNKEVSIETGDIAEGGIGFMGAMLGQEIQPEIVGVEAEPLDTAVIDNINQMEKRADRSTKENFAPIVTEAETLAVSLANTESQIPESAKSFDIAYQTRSRFVPPLDPSLLDSSVGLANSALVGENFESAIKWYQQSLDILEKWKPQDPAEKNAALARCLGGLAASYLRQGDGKSALPYAKRMYELVKSTYGSQSAQTCWGAATLGECFRLSRMDDQLRPLQDEMFEICLAKEGGLKRFRSMTSRSDEISDAWAPFIPKVNSRSELRRKTGEPDSYKDSSFNKCLVNASCLMQNFAMISNDVLHADSVLKQPFSQELPMRFWFPSATVPRGVIVCTHGMCLHSGSFSAMASSLQSRGFLVVGLDVRGLGTWKNSLGQNFLNLDGALADIHSVVERVHLLLPNSPIFLLGESMGGGIALHAAARHPEHLAGVISSVPGASRFEQRKETIMLILRLPFGIDRPLDIRKSLLSKATSSPQLREAWKSDPLSRKMLSPKELIAFQLFMSENEKYAVRIKSMPVMIIQGMDDHLVKPLSTLKVYRRISSIKKTLLKVNTGEHLTFEMNQCSPMVLDHVVDWIKSNSR